MFGNDHAKAAKLAAKAASKGQTYTSASAKADRRSGTRDANATDAAAYDAVRNTQESRQRRATHKSAEGRSRWSRSVDPKWNR